MRHKILGSLLATFILAIALPMLSGCPDKAEATVQLEIEAASRTVVANGENTVMIIVNATEDDSPARGTVTLTTTRGTFEGGSNTLQELLFGGVAEAFLVTCDSRREERCAGVVQVRVDMGVSHATTSITFEATTECDPELLPVDSCEHVETCQGLECGPHGLICDEDGECSCPGGVANEAQAEVGEGAFACGDGIDHDCDGLTDCEDPDCEGQPCDLFGMICVEGQCVCPHGFASEAHAQSALDAQEGLEEHERYACGDGIDWDCDGLVDCLDPDCNQMPCADFGHICRDGACVCPSGLTNESEARVESGTFACGDGIDHDCDGLTDCDDPDCEEEPCAIHGMVCRGGECVCSHGFDNEADAQDDLDERDDLEGRARYACGDGIDWDCDGLIDCQDSDCDGLPCQDFGRICVGGSCVCPSGVLNESLAPVSPGVYACGDGFDWDCDGLIDCADPDCDTQPCADGHICQLDIAECVPDLDQAQITFWHESHNQVLASNDTDVPLVVELRAGDALLSDRSVTFHVHGGMLRANGASTFTTTTNALGRATVIWAPGATPARNLRATVTLDETGASKWVEIQVIGLSSISLQNQHYTTMGVKHSDYQEENLITFTLRGTDGVDGNLEIPDGVPVTFSLSISEGEGGVELTRRDTTSVGGLVSTTVISGTVATVFTVQARASLGEEEDSAYSQSIAVVGAKPSQRGMTLTCHDIGAPDEVRRNIGLYTDHDGNTSQANISIECTVTLLDRFGNRIGIPTEVNFTSEAGNIDGPVTTNAQGEATTIFNTIGPLPRRVSPMDGEPSVTEDGEERNPRDGFIAIMAYTSGEEAFVDLNGNGVWDDGEPFITLGEPFLDTNDSGVRDPGEYFVPYGEDEDNGGEGGYQGPVRQTWSGNTLIWTETRLLATGHVVESTGDEDVDARLGFTPHSDVHVPWGGYTDVELLLVDENLNPPPANTTTTVSITHPTSNPPVTIAFDTDGNTFTYPGSSGWGSGAGSHIRWRRETVCADDTTQVCNGCTCGICNNQRCTIRSRVGPFDPDRIGHLQTVRLSRTTQSEGRDFEFRASYGGIVPAQAFYGSGTSESQPEN